MASVCFLSKPSSSTTRSTRPPAIRVQQTSKGLNSTSLMKPRRSTPTIAAGRKARTTPSHEAACARIVRHGDRDGPQLDEIDREHGQDRAELDQDLEGLVGLALEAKEMLQRGAGARSRRPAGTRCRPRAGRGCACPAPATPFEPPRSPATPATAQVESGCLAPWRLLYGRSFGGHRPAETPWLPPIKDRWS